MSLINDFTEFDAFKKCRELARVVGALTRTGRMSADPDLVRQIRRALVSILSNFAEGFEREGRQEFLQFLSISKGSVGEVRAQLIYVLDQGYLSEEEQTAADATAREAGRLIGGLMKHLNRCEIPGRKYLTGKKASGPALSTEPNIREPNFKTRNPKLETRNPALRAHRVGLRITPEHFDKGAVLFQFVEGVL